MLLSGCPTYEGQRELFNFCPIEVSSPIFLMKRNVMFSHLNPTKEIHMYSGSSRARPSTSPTEQLLLVSRHPTTIVCPVASIALLLRLPPFIGKGRWEHKRRGSLGVSSGYIIWTPLVHYSSPTLCSPLHFLFCFIPSSFSNNRKCGEAEHQTYSMSTFRKHTRPGTVGISLMCILICECKGVSSLSALHCLETHFYTTLIL